jgi:hypothetical protein
MGTATIDIQVESDVFEAYYAMPEERQKRLKRLLGFMLQEFVESSPQSLLTLMDEMSREATANGLTEDILESLLQDE